MPNMRDVANIYFAVAYSNRIHCCITNLLENVQMMYIYRPTAWRILHNCGISSEQDL